MSLRSVRLERSAARPRSVAAVVDAVRAGLRATLAVECALLFVAGGLLARAAALLSESGAGAGPLAGLCGALCAAAWWLEHPLARAQTARALDRRLRHHGALVTAYELEGRAAGRGLSSMEQLVCARVLARLRFGAAFQALFRPLFVPIGAPVAAALALWLVADARRGPPPALADLGALVDGLVAALGVGTGGPGEFDPGSDDAARREVLQQVRALEARLARGVATPAEGAPRDAELEARLAALDRGLAELAAKSEAEASPAGRSEAERLAEARVWLDALRMGLGARADAPPEARAAGTGAGPGTGTVADGTISPPLGTPPRADPGSTPLPPSLPNPASLPNQVAPAPEAPGATALGLQSGSFWPPEYDAVVERWVELSRAARDGGTVSPR